MAKRDKDLRKTDTDELLDGFDGLNDSIRDSIDLVKSLSKNIKSFPKIEVFKDFKPSMNKQMINDLDRYKESMGSIDKLSKRIENGRVKDKEIEKELLSLRHAYQSYLNDNESSFRRGGRFLKKQKELQEDINKKQSELNDYVTEEMAIHSKIDYIMSEMTRAELKLASETKQSEKDRLKEKIAQGEAMVKSASNAYKENQKKQRSIEEELESIKENKSVIDDTIKGHSKIKKLYEDTISGADLLYEANKKNSIWGKLTDEDLEKKIEGVRKTKEIASIFSGIWESVKKFAYEVSSNTATLSRTLLISEGSSRGLLQNLNGISLASGDASVTTTTLINSVEGLSKELGIVSAFSKDILVNNTRLVERMKISQESAAGLVKSSLIHNKSLEKTINSTLQVSQNLAAQNGIQLDQKEILEEIGKTSGQLMAMYEASPEKLAKAVTTAKLLGTSLEQVKNQAESLLDFESSIANELQAELITGRRLNLEKARSAALYGDMATVAKELTSQNINFGEFSQMNLIAQNKLASSLGLSSDQLSDQLLKLEYMGKSRKEIASLAGEEVAERLAAMSAEEKFAAAMTKLKDAASQMLAGPIGGLVDMLARASEHSWVLYTAFSAWAGISMVKMISQLGATLIEMKLITANAITTSMLLTAGISTAIIAASIAAIGSFNNAAKDMANSDLTPMAKGGIVYGPTPILAGEYNNAPRDPEVISPLSKLKSIIDSREQTQQNNEVVKALNAVNDVLNDIKKNTSDNKPKEGRVVMDGQKVGTIQMIGNYNIA